MSLHLEFEPHSWYMGAAITDCFSGENGTGEKWWEGYALQYLENLEREELAL